MQSLVYDFGQLNSDTERSYAKKIIENYVMNIIINNVYIHVYIIQEQKIKELDVCRVTDVLMACQDYMKKKDVSCFNNITSVNYNYAYRMNAVLSAYEILREQ